MHRALLFTTATIGAAACMYGQQWYCQNENSGNGTGYNCTGGIAFAAGGRGFFGHGTDHTGEASPMFLVYDPATNSTEQIGPPAPRAYATGFGIGDVGYVGLGVIDPVDLPEVYPPVHGDFFYAFDAFTGVVLEFITFPGGMRRNAIAFTIAGIAYVGGGLAVDTTGGMTQLTPVNDLWAYDPQVNTWSTRAGLPTTFNMAKAFSIAGKGYLMRDNSASLWEYDPVADSWLIRAAYPGGARVGFAVFVLNGNAYVGCGRNTSDRKDFHSYDPVTNSWSTAPGLWDDFGRAHAMGFTLGDSGYLVGGQRGSTPIRDGIWRFGPATVPAPDSWTQRPFLPAPGRTGSIAFSIGTKGYVGGGGSYTDFWEYDPATMLWTARAPLPGPVEEGFSIDGLGYVTRALASGNFYAYDPNSNTWTPRADLPGGARSQAACFAVEGRGYICSGTVNGTAQNDLWEYDPTTNGWTQRANRPNNPTYGAMGLAIGNKGYVLGGSQTSSSGASWNHQYDPSTDTWTTKASLPFGARRNGQAFAVGNLGYLGGGWAGSTSYQKRFDAYDPATDTWDLVGDMGGLYRHDGVGFSIGEKGYVFGGRRSMGPGSPPGSGSFYAINDLWEFNPTIIELDAQVMLDGPYNGVTGLMYDDLRLAGLLSGRDPYAMNGYPLPGGNYSDLPTAIPPASDANAVVDRVVVELRSAADPARIAATRHVWLQRDGDIVDMDGGSPVRFTLPMGNYHVAVRHRNHLGAMSAAPIGFGTSPASIDLSSPATATFGTDARRIADGVARLWCGDVTFDGLARYAGTDNDRDLILERIGGIVPTNVVAGYFTEDVNLDGVVKYAGNANDRDPILVTIGGSVPTSSRTAQLP
ncbi:MAG: kelch repeat-containing protein [Flavobacteriales bacterium]